MAYIDQLSYNPDGLDAAGNLPVSQRIITGNYLMTRDNLPLLIDRVGTGTQTYSNGYVDMSVGVGQYAIAQSKAFSPYLAGKPTSIKLTFFDMDNEVGVNKRVGFGSRSTAAPYNTDFDGFYFEATGTDYQIVTRNKQTTTTKTLPRANWIDKLDGTGASGITADFENFTVLEFDFLFLGGTALRAFINIGGQRIHFATIPWSNDNANTIFQTPFQPIFYEIRSTTGTGNLAQVCASTEIQGSLELVGVNRSINNAVTHVNANNTTDTYLLKAIRLKSANRDAFVKIINITALATTVDNFLYSVVLNPTFSAAPTWNGLSNSSIEEATGTGETITGGTVLASGYAANRSTLQRQVNGLIRLGSTFAGVMDEIVLAGRPITSNLDILGSIDVLEI